MIYVTTILRQKISFAIAFEILVGFTTTMNFYFTATPNFSNFADYGT